MLDMVAFIFSMKYIVAKDLKKEQHLINKRNYTPTSVIRNTKNECTGGFESYKNFARNICPLVYHMWLPAVPVHRTLVNAIKAIKN
jgi:hypothetical protein